MYIYICFNKFVYCLCILDDTDSLSQASSIGSSGVEEEEDEEPATLLRQHYDSLAVGTNGASAFSLLF